MSDQENNQHQQHAAYRMQTSFSPSDQQIARPIGQGNPTASMNVPNASPTGIQATRVTQLLAACKSCYIVVRIPGYDIAFRRVMEQNCPQCNSQLYLPPEVMEMLILYGHFIPEAVAATVTLTTMAIQAPLRADYVASIMNELLVPFQSDYVYDIAVPKRKEGLGMSLRLQNNDLVVGGFIDFEDQSENPTESPTVTARIISVGDILVAINKKSIVNSSFEKNIQALSHAASPVYLTFRRRQPVTVL